MNIAFVGGGNMATALIGGLVAKGADPRDFRVVEPLPAQQDRLTGRFPGIGIFGEPTEGAVAGADLVVMAVKPQQMRAAAMALAPGVADVPVVLSIAAGTRIADLARWLGGYTRIVRAMPNTPALIGAGISGVYATADVTDGSRRLATRVLEAAGAVLWVEREDLLDVVTGVSGSGPAYVFYFLEGLEEAAQAMGFAHADARLLAYATFAGAVKLAQASDLAPHVLRAQVTSKGGTTERALAVLEAGAVKAKFVAAVQAAAERAREMGDEFGREP
ncbi:MAG: pyrroline-5-carboxylate reductase [Betaproteobacteria bacterium]|nr:pyrroline-5-carboxylate reductase [Betaproteobacteria bacterium]MCC7217589.1 pyrroline-5-carboxylate reductase [Burkholderiales bacterium]